MNSTDEKHLLSFFERLRGPVAHGIRERDRTLFPTGPDGSESWYVDCDPSEPEFFTVETAELVPALRSIWLQKDLPELARLTGEFVEIAHQVRLDDDQSADLSPYIYVMY